MVKYLSNLVLYGCFVALTFFVQIAHSAENTEVNALKSVIALQEARLAAQDARIAALEKRFEGLRTSGETLYFKDKALAAAEGSALVWKGSPSGLKGDKGDKGDAGANGINGTNGLNGSPGINGASACNRRIRIRTGEYDKRGDTWLSLGWGVATTDARANHPNIVNFLECL